ncbi:hypothetical protein QZH41_018374 [Actinostola sp. cb2023]|nr:hypothetical protein QZH41_018374 [Actinostola sp. cb2023]
MANLFVQLFSFRMSIPARPNPPVVGKVTHNSIELYWNLPEQAPSHKGDDRPRYCIQEEEIGSRSKGFGNVYAGYANSYVFSGLEPRTQYRYRLRCINNHGNSAWSVIVTVTTTRKPKTSEDLAKAVAKRDLETVANILPELSWQAVDSPDKFGISPLMVAAQKGYVDIAQTLLDNKADVHFQNSSGKTALVMACFSGWTPLMRVAATSGNANVAKILIHHGANVNSMDRDRKTVLMNAALIGSEPLVKLLVKRGASINQKSDHGRTALDFARTFEHEHVVKFLQEQVDMWKNAEKQRKLEEAMSELKKQDNKGKKVQEEKGKENISMNGHL